MTPLSFYLPISNSSTFSIEMSSVSKKFASNNFSLTFQTYIDASSQQCLHTIFSIQHKKDQICILILVKHNMVVYLSGKVDLWQKNSHYFADNKLFTTKIKIRNWIAVPAFDFEINNQQEAFFLTLLMFNKKSLTFHIGNHDFNFAVVNSLLKTKI
jgi:hypothetical protein